MKRLLKLAQEIKNKSLRKKVTDFLRDLRLSSKDFKKYKKEDLKKAGSMFVIPTSGMGPIERDIIEHTVALTELCIKTANVFKKNYWIRK